MQLRMDQKDIEISFWRLEKELFKKSFSFDDNKIFYAKEVCIDYTYEIGLSYTKQKKLRQEWIKLLPQLDILEYLIVGHIINQEFFEAICSIPNLKGLYVKGSRINDFSPIRKLNSLEHLYFEGTKKIIDISGLRNLTNLISLELDGFYSIENLNDLEHLNNLESLMLFGSLHGKKIELSNIDGLKNISNLRKLALDIKSKGIDIKPIFVLKNLEKLIIPDTYFRDYNKDEIMMIFPKLKYGLINYK